MRSDTIIEAALRTFATQITAKFKLSEALSFQPEDQLKAPVVSLVHSIGNELKLSIQAVAEVHANDIAGRPDIGVTQEGLLIGHIELKAPGKGADVKRLKGRDKQQWEKFKYLPNVIYTDGNEWILYRTGERVGRPVRLPGDVGTDGEAAVDLSSAQMILELMRDFLQWEPVAPRSPKALATLLAPLCRLLRDEVQSALQAPRSNLNVLAQDWRESLFPDADDARFADAYAQTLTYALLLARLSGLEDLTVNEATQTLRGGHMLLSQALLILTQDEAREQLGPTVDLLERVLRAVDPAALMRPGLEDPWLYFYEDFLAVYDSKLRKDYGVYYTPIEVVQAQVRLVGELLQTRFGADRAFADENVVTLDPAVGTGTYILAATKYGLDAAAQRGPGARQQAATRMARNIHAFECLVGPYAVAHLRLTQQIKGEGGQLPADGVHVYLADTLESPYAKPPTRLPFALLRLGEEHQRAQHVKNQTAVMVCLGNPPYDREQHDDDAAQPGKRKGGWVRFGDGTDERGDRVRDGGGNRGAPGERPPLLQDFITPLNASGLGVHAKNLYNDYVYFWRWAIWKVFETQGDGGIVSFITAASYLRGQGFAGMRQVMRQSFDELFIIDLEGDNLGARKTENVFAIQTAVCIAIGLRGDKPQPDVPARIHYTRIEGSRKEKLAALGEVTRFAELTWLDCPNGWLDPFLPRSTSNYHLWPLVTDLFPWQENGIQFKRSWPIGESPDVLQARWKDLLATPAAQRGAKLKETGARTASRPCRALDGSLLPSLVSLLPGSTPVLPERYAFRSFDRQWILPDSRLCDRPRPALQSAHSNKQVYLTSLLTEVLGEGPAATATALLPDLHHFRGSFGGAHVIPLWRDSDGTQPNVTHSVLQVLSHVFEMPVPAEELFAYTYAMLSTPDYVHHFWEELRAPGPRLPLTRNALLFGRMAALGRELLWLHTFGQRFIPNGMRSGKLPFGQARIEVGTSGSADSYPEVFRYDRAKQELTVGEGAGAGVFSNVRQTVWDYSVSGLQVVKSWLSYRMKRRKGKASSPLDAIRPTKWEFDEELLDLLWVVDATVDRLPQLTPLQNEILAGELFTASNFPLPTSDERHAARLNMDLDEQIALDMLEDEEVEDEEEDPDVEEQAA